MVVSLKEKVRVQVGGEIGGDELGVLTTGLLFIDSGESVLGYLKSLDQR